MSLDNSDRETVKYNQDVEAISAIGGRSFLKCQEPIKAEALKWLAHLSFLLPRSQIYHWKRKNFLEGEVSNCTTTG